ncbi:ABC transporter permease [Georgenia sp. AZ-5]|uniref:ABC transporter permease n=1 Tax=Georgenia sp. AZ-5 TaxID=3367526 RepID=UPI00375523CA
MPASATTAADEPARDATAPATSAPALRAARETAGPGGSAPAQPEGRSVRRHRWLPAALTGVLGLVLWETVVRAGAISEFFLPAPSAVATRLWEDLTTGGILAYVGPTLAEALAGCLLASVVALPLGYLVFRSRWASAALEPYIAASQAVPAVAIAPLLTIWLGYGLVPIAVLCAIVVFFPILLATVLGLRMLDRDVVDAARLDGAGSWDLLRSIQLPLALPSLLTGLRNGFTLSVTGAVVGEFVIGGEGLGMVLSTRGASSDTTGLFATLVVLCALAMGIYGLLRALERHLERR